MAGREYDEIAETVFAPIYPIIADNIVRVTGVQSGRMVDIGCGGGHLGFAVMERLPVDGYFLDILPEAVEMCRQRGEKLGLRGRFWVHEAGVHQMPYPSGYAQLIISRGSMGFWGSYKQAFAEIYRVLAPQGRAYIGSGLGNAETQKIIHVEMKKRDPEWPESVRRKQHSLPTPEYVSLMEEVGFLVEVIENKQEGRWFVLRKK